ncbi:MAG: class I SAM-dependent methyltransferase [Clostridia bacterium]|nr:class I SAM-dependent methyltransferase [Clostridia bacterium]
MNDAIILENRAYWTKRAPGYSELNRQELAADRRGLWRRVLVERITERFPGRPHGDIHVLEVGTGPGFFAILLAEAGYRVTAIDLTPSMLAEAKKNAGPLGPRIRFMEMNAQALTFLDGRFDVILSRNVTWNLPDPELAYAEWARVLKPGGLLLNFDANWYRYLFDDDAKDAYARDRAASAAEGVDDLNVGEGFDRMEDIARRVPLSRASRPEWDVGVLSRMGLDAAADADVWKRVWSRQERVSLASTPMFMVSGIKRAAAR